MYINNKKRKKKIVVIINKTLMLPLEASTQGNFWGGN
jgi:hypothetical protein